MAGFIRLTLSPGLGALGLPPVGLGCALGIQLGGPVGKSPRTRYIYVLFMREKIEFCTKIQKYSGFIK